MRHSLMYAGLAASLVVAGCGDDGDGDGNAADADTRSFDRRALLQNLGDNIIVPTYEQFQTDAVALDTAVTGWCDALGGAGEAAALETAREAWRTAMRAWQRAEVMQLGPLAMDDGAPRDRIYSWPVVSTCAVDGDVELSRTDSNYDPATRLTNRRGLDALEYVLFTDSLDHSCGDAPTAPEGWDALPDAERREARCGYAAAVAGDVSDLADALVSAWAPGGGNYLATFVAADPAQEMLNAVSDAMFYLDTDVKDMKLGQPAGITDNMCSAVKSPCPKELESQHAGFSKQQLRANLEAFQALFTGGDGVGFDDWLIAFNAEALATEMTADIGAALDALDEIDGDLATALDTDYADVAAAHAAVKEITDDLKSQFLTVLGLDVPGSAAGDND